VPLAVSYACTSNAGTGAGPAWTTARYANQRPSGDHASPPGAPFTESPTWSTRPVESCTRYSLLPTPRSGAQVIARRLPSCDKARSSERPSGHKPRATSWCHTPSTLATSTAWSVATARLGSAVRGGSGAGEPHAIDAASTATILRALLTSRAIGAPNTHLEFLLSEGGFRGITPSGSELSRSGSLARAELFHWHARWPAPLWPLRQRGLIKFGGAAISANRSSKSVLAADTCSVRSAADGADDCHAEQPQLPIYQFTGSLGSSEQPQRSANAERACSPRRRRRPGGRVPRRSCYAGGRHSSAPRRATACVVGRVDFASPSDVMVARIDRSSRGPWRSRWCHGQ